MSFANPWAIWLGALLAPLLLAFLIRRWRRHRTVSSVVIFRRLAAQTATRRRFATPHHLVALLLSALALAALVMAALEPQGSEVPPRKYVVVLDTSASMSAHELGMDMNRFGRSVTGLAEFLDGLNPDDEVALVQGGAEASLMMGWTRDRSALLQRVSGVVPMGNGGGITEAFRIADAMCQKPEETEIVLLSDGGGLGVPELRCPLRYIRVGEEAVNLAVTALTVREADALGLNEVYLAVRNASDYARQVSVELLLDGVLVEARTEEMGADTTVERLIRLPLLGGEVLEARVSADGENALPQDDSAFAVLRPGARVQVGLITDHPTTFLAEALRLHPRVDLDVASPAALDPNAGPYDLLVVDAPYSGQLPRAEHLLALGVGHDVLGLASEGIVNEPEVIRWSFDHPLFRFVSLDGVRIRSATATRLPTGAVSLADMPDGPLIFALEEGGLEILYFTFHPDQSDLPLRVAFVNLVANIVEWAQPIDERLLSASVGIGERFLADSPGMTLEPVTATGSAAGNPARLDSRDPVPSAGVYRVLGSDGTERGLVAANLFSPAESDLTPVSRLGVGARQGWPEIARPDPFPWWMLALAAIAMLAMEWLLPGLIGLTYRFRHRREERRLQARVRSSLSLPRPSSIPQGPSAQAQSR